MRNLRLDICYDGTRYRGWQRLPGRDDTIQGKLETALSRILEEPIEVSGSGRTDAGVHALHQAANFHCESAMPAEEILSKLRQYLPEDIGIYSCVDVPPRFHARLNARAKTYRYRIWNSRGPCVFQRRYVAVMPERLDLNAMRRGAALLTGEHDFSAFCGNARMKSPPSAESIPSTFSGRGRKSKFCSPVTAFFTTWCGFWSARWWRSAGESGKRRAFRRCSAASGRTRASWLRRRDCA